ncbi:hypothetical protein [Neptunomonas japonica]|uniref:Uncharacterized protein n=1 Tax=Neptunomonas japonica JAMM 1380 TaxID=1441457 RepID=A0A7R6PH17_9GAMM|nr:hypothetical protein [Neptunomonas japonica]BBB30067.1 hypothetical protein NEJAP_2119 [Neptunomonas japonica JAMM 1380]
MLGLNHCYQMPRSAEGSLLSASTRSINARNIFRSNVKNSHAVIRDVVTEAELRLLAEWSVPNLIDILNFPEESVEKHSEDYIRFHERAGRVIEALLGSVKTDLLTVRFGVGGVISDLNVPFELNDEFLASLWRHERPISHWVRKESNELMGVAVLGRPYALAAATLDVHRISGMTRIEAIENQCYDAYLRQIYLRAFNLYGVFPLAHDELGIRGIDPWMQVAAGKDIVASACTGRQLQLFARRQFRDFKISFEVYSILKHLPLRLGISARLAVSDWDSLLQEELSAAWLRGETGEWIEKALDSITDSKKSDAQGYMLGA